MANSVRSLSHLRGTEVNPAHPLEDGPEPELRSVIKAKSIIKVVRVQTVVKKEAATKIQPTAPKQALEQAQPGH
jgi:hypothetical protein